MGFSDFIVHFGLRKLRFVDFIMSIFSVTNQVNHEVFLVFMFVFYGQFDSSVYIFDIV